MNYTENGREGNQLVYGFLCEQTNVFYAFETYEEYQEFLFWLERENQAVPETQTNSNLSEDELVNNFNRATDKIMEVFNDPIFAHDDGRMELEEIDF
jgi:hypothetical protein